MFWFLLSAVATAGPFDACLEDNPPPDNGKAIAICTYREAKKSGEMEAGVAFLQPQVAANPDDGFLLAILGTLYNTGVDIEKAEELWKKSVDVFEAQENYSDAIIPTLNLSNWYARRGDLEAGRATLDRAMAMVEGSEDVVLQTRVEVQLARWYHYTEGEQFLALEHATNVWDAVGELGMEAYQPKVMALGVLIGVNEVLNRHDQVEAYTAAQLALAREREDRYSEANIRFNIVSRRLNTWFSSGRPAGEAAALEAALEETLAFARDSGNTGSEAVLPCMIAAVNPDRSEGFDEGRAIAMERKEPQLASECDLLEVLVVGVRDPEAARPLVLRSEEAAVQAGFRSQSIRAQHVGTQLLWRLGADEAAEESLSVLDDLELLTDLQNDEVSRLYFLSDLAGIYYSTANQYRLTGDDAAAFGVIERLRARELLLQLAHTDAAPRALTEGASAEAYASSLEAISALQNQLIAGELDDLDDAMRQLERLEGEARSLRDEQLRALPLERGLELRQQSGADLLSQLQAALAPHEALVTWQSPMLDPDELTPLTGWAWVVTASNVRAVPMPSRASLTDQIDLFIGLFAERSASEAVPAARLYGELVAPLLDGLSGEVTDLVLVPDGPLHRLPFAALGEAGGAPLGARYAISRAPSANLWLRWRQRERSPAGVLALADPAHPGLGDGEALTRSLAWEELGSLGSLPHARDEVESLVRATGGVSWVGESASEAALKVEDFTDVGVLHFAAHAVADARFPERSSILLAPGAATEDGLLQAREIADLSLPGRLVVLSACQSATGAVLPGEGVVGLSRSFFQAGAHGVIGSLWPLRDEEAAAFFSVYYEHLAAGASAAEALRLTREQRIAAGAPAAEWAGLVLIGDGAMVPLEPSGPLPERWWLWLAGGLLVAGMGWRASRGAGEG